MKVSISEEMWYLCQVFRFSSSLALYFARTSSQVTRTDDWFISKLWVLLRLGESICSKLPSNTSQRATADVNRNIIKVLTRKRGQEREKHSRNSQGFTLMQVSGANLSRKICLFIYFLKGNMGCSEFSIAVQQTNMPEKNHLNK